MSGECLSCSEHALECKCKPFCWPQQNGWISVLEGKPIVGRICLLYQTYPPRTLFNMRADFLPRCFLIIGGIRHDGSFISYNDQYSIEGLPHISHWQYAPEPPKKI